MNMKKTVSLLLSATLAAGAFCAAPVLPDGTALFSAPILAEASGTVISGQQTDLQYQCSTNATLYFVRNSSNLTLCGSKLTGSNVSVTVPRTVTFSGVTRTVTAIGANAFKNQTNLGDFTFNGTQLTSIGASAFKGCTSLSFWQGKPGDSRCAVQTVSNNAFENCTAMTGCAAADGATEIGYNAFKNCTSLGYISLYRAQTIRGAAFYGCSGLKSAQLTDTSITEIEDRAFCDCTSLENVSLPETLTTISYDVFRNCRSLEKIYLPDSVREIGQRAFYDCRSLKTVMMSENITQIYDLAFCNCTAMKYFVCKNPNASTLAVHSIGYHKENGAFVRNSGFVIWGRGGTIQSYANGSGFEYHNVSEAARIASNRYISYEWKRDNQAAYWGVNGNYYFNSAHLPYANGNAGQQFRGICSGMAIVSALTSSGYLPVSDYAPGYNRIRDINTLSANTKSYVTTVWANQQLLSDYSLMNHKFTKESMRYAEYITYGADAAVLSADMINGDGHGMVCFGLEFKENASDVSYNSRWNGKDARMLIYNVNCTEHSIGDYIYVNLSDGNWYWNGSRVFGNAYVQSQCLLTLTHSYNKMLSAADPDQFFAAIRN